MGRDPREISRLEPCGCKSYRLDDPDNPDSEEFWVQEATCPVHVYHFKLDDERMRRHINIDHGVKGNVDRCDRCGYFFSTDDLFLHKNWQYWCTGCKEADTDVV